MMCPVALFADALTWLFRAGILLAIRLTSAVALAATAFSAIIVIAENFHTTRGTIGADKAILSEVIDRPLVVDADSAPIKVAASFH